MSQKLILKNVRVNYVNLAKPRGYNDDEPKYSVQIIMPKGSDNEKALLAAIAAETLESFGSKTIISDNKKPIRDGNADSGKRGPDYKDHIYIQASSRSKPGVVLNKKGDAATDGQIKEFGFNGSVMHVSINVAAFTFKNTKGIATYLNNVMLTDQDSPPLGSVTSLPTDDFSSVSDDDGVSDSEVPQEEPFKEV